MTDSRKPFHSITSDIDDDAIEAVARAKGVPSLARPSRLPTKPNTPSSAGIGDASDIEEALDDGPTPRSRMAYVKACLPDYALIELKTRAARERVSLNHILMRALTAAGIPIKAEDMVEDGRRLRGSASRATR